MAFKSPIRNAAAHMFMYMRSRACKTFAHMRRGAGRECSHAGTGPGPPASTMGLQQGGRGAGKVAGAVLEAARPLGSSPPSTAGTCVVEPNGRFLIVFQHIALQGAAHANGWTLVRG